MKVIVAGGTGFIGSRLCQTLADKGHDVVVLTRSPCANGNSSKAVGWDGATSRNWGHLIEKDCALVNLAGSPIARRWTRKVRHQIMNSRINAGRAMVKAVELARENGDDTPSILIQGSAVGFYGPRPNNELLDEDSGNGSGFLAEVARAWEDSSRPVENLGVRRVVVRTGVVLGQGGMLNKMVPPFKKYVGGPLGNGHHGISWIHLDDQVAAITYLLENSETRGTYNLTAPNPVTNRDFSKSLGKVLHRPSFMRLPGFVLKTIYGRMAKELLLTGQKVMPARLTREGFRFKFPYLETALTNILDS